MPTKLHSLFITLALTAGIRSTPAQVTHLSSSPAMSVMVHAPGVPAKPVSQTNAPIPWDQIGAKVGADYHGDGLAVTPASEGARLHCVFQRLDGEATRAGLWLVSTATNTVADRFQVKAAAIGRTDEKVAADLSAAGEVVVNGQNVSFVRPGLTEEYSVSMDGVRQDFLVQEKPVGVGELRVRLEVSGAQVKSAAEGAQLVLAKSGRKIAYNRLHVTDATGKELAARMEAGTELTVFVHDAGAVYPVRIDPTFSDANWVSMGGMAGVNTQYNPAVYALLVSGSTLYAGGNFTTAGGVPANAVAKWDGSNWSALGGLNGGAVRALAVDGNGNLYAGGTFSPGVGAAANYIAQWNGSNWSSLGLGMNSYVNALAVDGNGNLYAGGDFTTAGGVAANYIAQWNGTNWSTLGGGMNSYVNALLVSGSTLYAGGQFTTATNSDNVAVAANCIAQWNGTNWSALGSGVNGTVYALAVSGSTLYAGGSFYTSGGFHQPNTNANYIAKWNGTNWSALGAGVGLSGGNGPSISALAVDGIGNLYAGGYFTTAGAVTANNIAKWDGTNWIALGSGTGISVSALVVSGGSVYAGGSFTTAGGVTVNDIAQWNGSSWNELGVLGLNSGVSALVVSGSNLYVAGSFSMAGSVATTNLAQWNGSSWSALAPGLVPYTRTGGGGGSGGGGLVIYALAVSGSNLYAGGSFSLVGNTNNIFIAQWNGSSWSAMGSGMNGAVHLLAVSGSTLYAGGSFTTAGEVAATNIAQWNGTNWSALGSGIAVNSGEFLKALAVSSSILYAGGFFNTFGGVTATNIAQWNGTKWSALGLGINYLGVDALAVSGGNLYAGGDFQTAGGIAATNIARWNGTNWSALGSGIIGEVYALAVSGSTVYAGGYFTTAGGVAANYIAQWNGTNWSALGSGVNSYVNALAVSSNALYAEGTFTAAGGKDSAYVAEALFALPPPPLVIVTTNGGLGFANKQFRFILTGPTGSNVMISASTNLQNWQPLATNPLGSGSLNFTDTLATNYPSRYYRATLQP